MRSAAIATPHASRAAAQKRYLGNLSVDARASRAESVRLAKKTYRENMHAQGYVEKSIFLKASNLEAGVLSVRLNDVLERYQMLVKEVSLPFSDSELAMIGLYGCDTTAACRNNVRKRGDWSLTKEQFVEAIENSNTLHALRELAVIHGDPDEITGMLDKLKALTDGQFAALAERIEKERCSLEPVQKSKFG